MSQPSWRPPSMGQAQPIQPPSQGTQHGGSYSAWQQPMSQPAGRPWGPGNQQGPWPTPPSFGGEVRHWGHGIPGGWGDVPSGTPQRPWQPPSMPPSSPYGAQPIPWQQPSSPPPATQQPAYQTPSADSLSQLFARSNIQIPSGFMDQLIQLLGGQSPSPRITPPPSPPPAPPAPPVAAPAPRPIAQPVAQPPATPAASVAQTQATPVRLQLGDGRTLTYGLAQPEAARLQELGRTLAPMKNRWEPVMQEIEGVVRNYKDYSPEYLRYWYDKLGGTYMPPPRDGKNPDAYETIRKRTLQNALKQRMGGMETLPGAPPPAKRTKGFQYGVDSEYRKWLEGSTNVRTKPGRR